MYQTFYLYLSGSWKFGDYSIQLAYNLNCYWFPQPTATICFYIFPFPKNELLSHPFETQGRPGRLTVSQLCPTLCDPVNLSMPGLPVHHQLPESTQTHVHWVGDAIQPSHLCRPLLLLPSIFPSIRVFSNESAVRIRWPKYWSFSFNISPSNEHPGLISFRMDWLDLLALQGTLKSLFQHHGSKASILWHSAFFTVQLSHPYTHWKNHSLE